MPNITDRQKADGYLAALGEIWAAPDTTEIIHEAIADHSLPATAHGVLAIRQTLRELDETLRYLFKKAPIDTLDSDFVLLKIGDGEENSVLLNKSEIMRVRWDTSDSCLVSTRSYGVLTIQNGNLIQFASDLGAF